MLASCEIHKLNYHNQSRQQQPPHKQTRKHELALWWLTTLPGWRYHTGGSWSKPTVHPCALRWGGCGLLTSTPTHNNEPKKTQHNNNMAAEQVLRDLNNTSRVTRVLVDTQIPWMLMRSILFCLAKEKGHRVRAFGVLGAVEHIFNEIAMQAIVWQRQT